MFDILQTRKISIRKIKKKCQKKIYIETIDHGKVTETYVAEILQNKIYHDKFIYLKTSVNEVIL